MATAIAFYERHDLKRLSHPPGPRGHGHNDYSLLLQLQASPGGTVRNLAVLATLLTRVSASLPDGVELDTCDVPVIADDDGGRKLAGFAVVAPTIGSRYVH